MQEQENQQSFSKSGSPFSTLNYQNPKQKYLNNWCQRFNKSQAELELFERIQQRLRNCKKVQNQFCQTSHKRRQEYVEQQIVSLSLLEKTNKVFWQVARGAKSGIRPTRMFMERWMRNGCCTRCTLPVRISRANSPPNIGSSFEGRLNKAKPINVQQNLGQSLGQIISASVPLLPHQYGMQVEGGKEPCILSPINYLMCEICGKPFCCNCEYQKADHRQRMQTRSDYSGYSQLQSTLGGLRGSRNLQSTLIDLNVDLKTHRNLFSHQ
eukprot:TRINITY_DN101512_c0_g1_i2.p1 TRINITY_DN101512_c0_g1~~TRINITY_DN101512_c0_g1_i2.p1  ORF type:complete len:313 (-),score=9.19 TRINITY_DN101512_c0_g1_i2:355-1155(-)